MTHSFAAIAVVVTQVLGALAPAPATVEPPPVTWQVQPAPVDGASRVDFAVALEPGGRATDAIQVSNLGQATITLDIAPMAIVLTESGAPTVPLEPSGEPSAADWVTVRDSIVTLDPGESTEVPFVLVVPQRAEPGDYGVAVVASISHESTTDDGQQVIVDARVGARMYLRVLGDLRSALTVTEVTVTRDAPWWNPLPRDTTVDFVVENTGNVRLDSTAVASITGPFGWELGVAEPQVLPQLLPGDKVRLSAIADGAGEAVGPMTVPSVLAAWVLNTTVRIDAVETSTGQSFEYVTTARTNEIPWIPLTVLVIALGLVTLRLVRRSRSRKQVPSPTAEGESP